MPRNDRQDRINELVKWASEQGLEKEIPKRWIEEGDIPYLIRGLEGADVMDKVASRAKVLYAVTEKTAQDYADVVVRRLIAQMSKSNESGR